MNNEALQDIVLRHSTKAITFLFTRLCAEMASQGRFSTLLFVIFQQIFHIYGFHFNLPSLYVGDG
jgi:hypothetical protein